jgi:hypothetical protein
MAKSMTVEQLVVQIHAAPGQMVLAVTGGGSAAISGLLTVPGGSRTLLEAIVPYSAESLVKFLHGRPEHFCSARTARMMAMAAFQRARHLQAAGQASLVEREEGKIPAIGIGCTASLASDRPKRGPHRIHVALQTANITVTHSLELIKARRTRTEEEEIAAGLILNTVAEAFDIGDRTSLDLFAGEQIESTRTKAPTTWKALLLGQLHLALGDYTRGNAASTPFSLPLPPTSPIKGEGVAVGAVFPGAFNPLHPGHLRMAEIAAARLAVPVNFELSIENVDKPPLDYTEMEQRAAQFTEQRLPLWFTRAPTFEEKSRLFPGATFIVGADTLVRIGEPRYYGNDSAAMEAAVQQIAERGCRFLVFGRLVDGKFQSLADLPLPESLRKLCDEVPPTLFREDISSTELRKPAETDP